jgi:hypothetical protein
MGLTCPGWAGIFLPSVSFPPSPPASSRPSTAASLPSQTATRTSTSASAVGSSAGNTRSVGTQTRLVGSHIYLMVWLLVLCTIGYFVSDYAGEYSFGMASRWTSSATPIVITTSIVIATCVGSGLAIIVVISLVGIAARRLRWLDRHTAHALVRLPCCCVYHMCFGVPRAERYQVHHEDAHEDAHGDVDGDVESVAAPASSGVEAGRRARGAKRSHLTMAMVIAFLVVVWGVMGLVQLIPASFQMSHILHSGNHSDAAHAMCSWSCSCRHLQQWPRCATSPGLGGDDLTF